MCAAMATTERGGGLRIGEVLKRARRRLRLDVATVEERTKIRTKYLRALEAEDWNTLPGPTYVKGFLRSYAQLLGIDGEALVDEYRRRVESALPDGGLSPLREPPLEHRRRPTMQDQRATVRRRMAVGALVGIAGIAGVVALLAGGSDEAGKRHGHHRHAGAGHHGEPHRHHATAPAGGTVTLALEARTDVEVCLVRGSGEAQIDSQTLTAGASAGPFNPPAERYELDLDSGGSLQLTLNDRTLRVSTKRPASYEITAGGVRPVDYRGSRCP
jgi:hypothetical protein